jgi:PAS domain S-box-containing protein
MKIENKSTATFRDLVIISISAIFVFVLAAGFDAFEKFVGWSRTYEGLEIDEVVIAVVSLAFALGIFSLRRWRELSREAAEHRRAGEALRESEERFRSLVAAAPDGIALTDDQGTILEVNEAFVQMHGYGRDEMLGKSFLEFIPRPETRARIEQALQVLYEVDGLPPREVIVTDRTGARVPAEQAVSVVKDDSGKVTNFICVLRDIAERKRAEEELEEYRERLEELVVRRTAELMRANERLQREIEERKWANKQLQQEIEERRRAEKALLESERLYRLLAENVTDVIWVTDMNMRLTYITPSVTFLLGYSVEEARALTVEEIMTPASLEAIMKPRAEGMALMGQESLPVPQPEELEFYCKDGSTVWVETRVSLLRGESGWPVGILGVNRDITERKRAQEALRESEAKYRTLVERIPAITYIAALDEISTTLYFSPQIEEILDFTQAEWLAQPDLFFRQLHPDDRERVMAELSRSRASGEPFKSEYRLLARDDRVVWFRDEAVVVRDDADNSLFLQGVMFDISERKRAEEQPQASPPRDKDASASESSAE